MLKGLLTYLGGAGFVLSWLGERFGVPVAAEEAEQLITAVGAAVSAIAVFYGRWRATRKPA